MSINFRTHNGLCPYFECEENIFHIQDIKAEHGYRYALYHQKKNSETVEHFGSQKKAIKHVSGICKATLDYKAGDRFLYSTTKASYIVDPNGKVITWQKPVRISKVFEKYTDCLYFGKQYVARFIKEQEPKQISFY